MKTCLFLPAIVVGILQDLSFDIKFRILIISIFHPTHVKANKGMLSFHNYKEDGINLKFKLFDTHINLIINSY